MRGVAARNVAGLDRAGDDEASTRIAPVRSAWHMQATGAYTLDPPGRGTSIFASADQGELSPRRFCAAAATVSGCISKPALNGSCSSHHCPLLRYTRPLASPRHSQLLPLAGRGHLSSPSSPSLEHSSHSALVSAPAVRRGTSVCAIDPPDPASARLKPALRLPHSTTLEHWARVIALPNRTPSQHIRIVEQRIYLSEQSDRPG